MRRGERSPRGNCKLLKNRKRLDCHRSVPFRRLRLTVGKPKIRSFILVLIQFACGACALVVGTLYVLIATMGSRVTVNQSKTAVFLRF